MENNIHEDTKIWRYLDFTKFLSLLDTKSLFLSRSDMFNDSFEGAITAKTQTAREETYRRISSENFDEGIEQHNQLMERLRYYTHINCWHINENESDAMWKIYVKHGNGIAIQSTYKRLESVLSNNNDIRIKKVNYIDHDSDTIPEIIGAQTFNYLSPYLHKKNSFRHEQELRVIIQDFDPKTLFETEKGELGINISINLSDLIEKIYVSPLASSWFFELVQSILTKYNLSQEIIYSKLNGPAIF